MCNLTFGYNSKTDGQLEAEYLKVMKWAPPVTTLQVSWAHIVLRAEQLVLVQAPCVPASSIHHINPVKTSVNDLRGRLHKNRFRMNWNAKVLSGILLTCRFHCCCVNVNPGFSVKTLTPHSALHIHIKSLLLCCWISWLSSTRKCINCTFFCHQRKRF